MDWFDSLIDWIKQFFTGLVDFFLDLPVILLEGILGAISSLISSIPVPDFASSGFQTVISSFPTSVLWAMSVTGIPECLAIIGTGVAFRLTRKLFTLGQW